MPTAAPSASDEQPVLRRLALGVFAQQLGVVLARELSIVLQLLLDVGDDRAEIAPFHVHADVDAPRAASRLMTLGDGTTPLGHVPEPHVPAGGRVDEQLRDAGQAVPRSSASRAR